MQMGAVREAMLPLEGPAGRRWVQRLANEINGRDDAGGDTIIVNVQNAYGFDDFERKVTLALTRSVRKGQAL